MRIVVDTNIVFSALINAGSTIPEMIVAPFSDFKFFTSDYLFKELENHKSKLSIFLDAHLWTGDKVLYVGLKKKGFDNVLLTPELREML